jgi:hypothetical protein
MNTLLAKIFTTLIFPAFILHGCATSQSTHDTVCITKTGQKYHSCTCRYVDQRSEQISREDAIARNYVACQVCNPDITQSSADSTAPSDHVKPTVTQKDISTQCTSLTKSGLRCKRKADTNTGKCWQHQ